MKVLRRGKSAPAVLCGVAVARDGALFVSDDGSNTVWRVSYSGR